jgi:DNA invertase Pin-like site-specific DNA recombinase
MDVAKMLSDLRQEREQIEEAILSLERLARNRGRRRGRPPAWMQEVKKRGRPPGSKNKPKLVESKAKSAMAVG